MIGGVGGRRSGNGGVRIDCEEGFGIVNGLDSNRLVQTMAHLLGRMGHIAGQLDLEASDARRTMMHEGRLHFMLHLQLQTWVVRCVYRL